MATLIFFIAVCATYLAVFRYPGAACGLVLVSFAVEQFAQATVPITASFSSLCNYLMVGAVLLAVTVQSFRYGSSALKFHLSGIVVLVLLAYCCATLLWTIFPSTTERLLRGQIPVVAVFVGLAPMAIRRAEDMEHAIVCLIIGATLSLLGLIVSGDWASRGVVLLNGEESNPLALTQAAGSLFIAASLTDVLPKYLPRFWPFAAVVVASVVLLTFLRSGSRGQVVAATGVVLLFSALRRGSRWVPLAVLLVLGLLAMGFLAGEVEQNAARWSVDRVDHDMSAGRAGVAASLLEIWARSAPERIWLGLGCGTAQDPRLLGAYPHVVPAEVLAEEGVLGFCIYLATLLVALKTYLQAYKSQSSRLQGLVLTASAMALYEVLLTLKQGTLLGDASALMLLVLAGPLADRSTETESALGSSTQLTHA